MRLGRIAVLSTIVPAVVGVVATPVVEADAITLLGFQSRDVIVQVFANESSAQKSQRVDDDGLRSARVTGDVSAGTATALSEASQTSYVGTAALGGALAVSGVSRAAEFDRAYAVAQSLFGVQFEINDPHRFDWWVTLDVALSDSTRVVSSASLRGARSIERRHPLCRPRHLRNAGRNAGRNNDRAPIWPARSGDVPACRRSVFVGGGRTLRCWDVSEHGQRNDGSEPGIDAGAGAGDTRVVHNRSRWRADASSPPQAQDHLIVFRSRSPLSASAFHSNEHTLQ